jgi:serine/threonine protein kinase
VAIKVLNKNSKDMAEVQRAKREIETKTGHPNITKLLYVEETQTEMYLVQEYVPKGELLSYILKNKRLSEEESRKLFMQILSSIECCHSKRIVHRDIKHQNLLLDSNHNIKLIDFGFSSFLEEGVPQTTFCGTPAYAAPEIVCIRFFLTNSFSC